VNGASYQGGQDRVRHQDEVLLVQEEGRGEEAQGVDLGQVLGVQKPNNN